MKLFRTRHRHIWLAIIAVALLSAVSYPLYRTFEGPIREALGLPPPPETLSFDVGKYSVELVRNWDTEGAALISSWPHVWKLKGRNLGAYEFSTGDFLYTRSWSENRDAPKSQKLIMSRDINSDGCPEVVIMDNSGGTACNVELYVLRLGKQVDYLLEWPEAYVDVSLSDLDNDGNMEILAGLYYDWKYWPWARPSPDVDVVYKWRNGSYRLATPEFHDKYIPLIEEKVRAYPAALEQARGAGFGDGVTSQKYPPVQMWEIMIDYIYLGEAMKAREAFDRLWPPELPGKDETLAHFDEWLTNTRFCKETNDATAPEKRWPPVAPPPPTPE
jgi:hypothetical protein